jgi:CcmD family protein
MYENKLFVVIGVITLIFTGIIIYLISIDRKVSKLKKELKKRNVNTP